MVKKGNSPFKKLWNKSKFRWLVFFLAFIALNFGLYRVEKWWEMKKILSRQASPLSQSVREVTPTLVVPVGWNLHTHEAMGVQIMHPLKVAVFDDELKFVLRSTEIVRTGQGQNFPKFTIRVYLAEEGTSKTPQSFALEALEAEKVWVKKHGGNLTDCVIQEVVRDSLSGRRLMPCSELPGKANYTNHFMEWFWHRGNLIGVEVALMDEARQAQVDLILSSLKFLDKVSPPPANAIGSNSCG